MKFSISRSFEGGVVEHASSVSSTELDIINTVITEKALRVKWSPCARWNTPDYSLRILEAS